MALQPLDESTQYVLMCVGLVFAFSGLYFILKRKDDASAARIELFGLKFQSSSVGTLVFLIGAVFLLTPLFVPKLSEEETDGTEQLAKASSADPVTPATRNDSTSGSRAVLLPASADTPEIEPNDQITQSNQLELGFGVKGTLDRARKDLNDWYVIDLSGSEKIDFGIKVRNLEGGCYFTVFDQDEEQLGYKHCNNGGGSQTLNVFADDSDKIFVRVQFNGGSSSSKAQYELFAQEK